MPPNPSSLPTRAAMYAALMGFRSVWQTRGPGTSNADVWKHDDERGIGWNRESIPPRCRRDPFALRCRLPGGLEAYAFEPRLSPHRSPIAKPYRLQRRT
jgi:hypothetical protein